eukprot:TRINITY_DN4995_c0_g2_i1.p1 TRINITY_DN4995_c0_g2~~TRINITY_DN4995_c0_g2_i1.p1  ORF type:complete len:1376 (-),score=165.18 TRINITY_DN4995_c0_g2_i1:89-4216(-)
MTIPTAMAAPRMYNSFCKRTSFLSRAMKLDFVCIRCILTCAEPAHLLALCSVRASTKFDKTDEDGKIGEKGIGFKSVFKAASQVDIYSEHAFSSRREQATYQFSLSEQPTCGVGFVYPTWIEGPMPVEVEVLLSGASGTCLVLHLKKTALEPAIKSLREFAVETIMFLKKVEHVSIEVQDSSRTYKCVRTPISACAQTCSLHVDDAETAKYFVHHKVVDIDGDQLCEQRRRGVTKRRITTAMLLSPKPAPQKVHRFHTARPTPEGFTGRIFAFLPTQIRTELPCIVNADFLLAASREQMHDTAWNRTLCSFIGPAIAEAALALTQTEWSLLALKYVPLASGQASNVHGLSYDDVQAKLKRAAIVPVLIPLNPARTDRFATAATCYLLHKGFPLPSCDYSLKLVHPDVAVAMSEELGCLDCRTMHEYGYGAIVEAVHKAMGTDTLDPSWFGRVYSFLAKKFSTGFHCSNTRRAYARTEAKIVLLDSGELIISPSQTQNFFQAGGRASSTPVYLLPAKANLAWRKVAPFVGLRFVHRKVFDDLNATQRARAHAYLSSGLQLEELTSGVIADRITSRYLSTDRLLRATQMLLESDPDGIFPNVDKVLTDGTTSSSPSLVCATNIFLPLFPPGTIPCARAEYAPFVRRVGISEVPPIPRTFEWITACQTSGSTPSDSHHELCSLLIHYHAALTPDEQRMLKTVLKTHAACAWLPTTQGLQRPADTYMQTPELREAFGETTVPFLSDKFRDFGEFVPDLMGEATLQALKARILATSSRPIAERLACLNPLLLCMSKSTQSGAQEFFSTGNLLIAENSDGQLCAANAACLYLKLPCADMKCDLPVVSKRLYPDVRDSFFKNDMGMRHQYSLPECFASWQWLCSQDGISADRVETVIRIAFKCISRCSDFQKYGLDWLSLPLWTGSKFAPRTEVFVQDVEDASHPFAQSQLTYVWLPPTIKNVRMLIERLKLPLLSNAIRGRVKECSNASESPLLNDDIRRAVCAYVWTNKQNTRHPHELDELLQSFYQCKHLVCDQLSVGLVVGSSDVWQQVQSQPVFFDDDSKTLFSLRGIALHVLAKFFEEHFELPSSFANFQAALSAPVQLILDQDLIMPWFCWREGDRLESDIAQKSHQGLSTMIRSNMHICGCYGPEPTNSTVEQQPSETSAVHVPLYAEPEKSDFRPPEPVKVVPSSNMLAQRAGSAEEDVFSDSENTDEESQEELSPLSFQRAMPSHGTQMFSIGGFGFGNRRNRTGRKRFNGRIFKKFNSRCMISGNPITAVLQAAHIDAYASSQDNSYENGLLLRADLHLLYDAKMLRFEADEKRPGHYTVHFSGGAETVPEYQQYHRKPLFNDMQLDEETIQQMQQYGVKPAPRIRIGYAR